MAVTQTLSEWYSKAEDKYFSLLDWLDAKGIPVYAYSNALESHGIPSFPFTICLIILILALLVGLFLLPSQTHTTILVGLTDQSKNALSDVEVKILDESGKALFDRSISNGDSIKLSGVGGHDLTVSASKDGYDAVSQRIQVRSENENVALILNRQLHAISAKVRFVDSQTGLPIGNAQVSLSWNDIVRTGKTDANGFFTAEGLPENEDVLLAVNADNYEPL
ncbi:MAG: carboxypeptidase-like regulatory domain-containing protein, partial [Candidatus Diapherotrites archaeon]|nr:carboxypeptidase-like regulatory domain-containing protein [Candidatus Diapherotrites archaeon]